MKKYILILLAVCFTFSLEAQNVIGSFLNKHGKDGSLQIVSIGKKMFETIEEQALGTPELLQAINGLENIQIVSSKESELNKEYYQSVNALLEEDASFQPLFSMNTENVQLQAVMKSSKGVINELIVLSYDQEKFTLISMVGELNLELLANYTNAIALTGVDCSSHSKKDK